MRPLFVVLLLMSLSGCSRLDITGPLTLEDATKANFGMPLYSIDANSPYSRQLQTILFHIVRDDVIKIETYFAANDSPTKSVAQMTAYTLLKAGPDTPQGQVNILWAQTGVGYLCKRPVNLDNREPFEDSSYSMCVYWMDIEHTQYILYSNWSEAETLNFINSLIKFN